MSVFSLKIIALLSMIVDHFITADILSQTLLISVFHFDLQTSATVLRILSLFGRISFPIFAFFIAEGYRHTHSVGKYLLRILSFAILSEIPFDLALTPMYGEWFNMITIGKHLNVLFTFALSIIGLHSYHILKSKTVSIVIQLGALAIPLLLAEVFGTDYSFCGVAFVYIAYFGFQKKWQYIGMIAILFVLYVVYASGFFMNLSKYNIYEWIASCCALLFIYCYNKKRGASSKWLFYSSYPIHLVIIALIRFITV